jgi:hypothetical protein
MSNFPVFLLNASAFVRRYDSNVVQRARQFAFALVRLVHEADLFAILDGTQGDAFLSGDTSSLPSQTDDQLAMACGQGPLVILTCSPAKMTVSLACQTVNFSTFVSAGSA